MDKIQAATTNLLPGSIIGLGFHAPAPKFLPEGLDKPVLFASMEVSLSWHYLWIEMHTDKVVETEELMSYEEALATIENTRAILVKAAEFCKPITEPA